MATKKFKFTKAAWRRWLATISDRTRFNYMSNGNCAVARFLRSKNPRKKIFVGGSSFSIAGFNSELPDWVRVVLWNARKPERIFLGRALKAASKQVIGL